MKTKGYIKITTLLILLLLGGMYFLVPIIKNNIAVKNLTQTAAWIYTLEWDDQPNAFYTELEGVLLLRNRKGLLAIDQNTGKELWRYIFLDKNFQNRVVVSAPDIVCVWIAGLWNRVVRLDPLTGEEKWRHDNPKDIGEHSNIWINEGFVCTSESDYLGKDKTLEYIEYVELLDMNAGNTFLSYKYRNHDKIDPNYYKKVDPKDDFDILTNPNNYNVEDMSYFFNEKLNRVNALGRVLLDTMTQKFYPARTMRSFIKKDTLLFSIKESKIDRSEYMYTIQTHQSDTNNSLIATTAINSSYGMGSYEVGANQVVQLKGNYLVFNDVYNEYEYGSWDDVNLCIYDWNKNKTILRKNLTDKSSKNYHIHGNSMIYSPDKSKLVFYNLPNEEPEDIYSKALSSMKIESVALDSKYAYIVLQEVPRQLYAFPLNENGLLKLD
ncbi:MAG: hypothetical protein GY810_06255 [Aureispira sp.]|nr:hypothetical protein [Aureispira sp.]